MRQRPQHRSDAGTRRRRRVGQGADRRHHPLLRSHSQAPPGRGRQRCRAKGRRSMADDRDDSFELYDLRVEVTAPGGQPDLLRRQGRRLFRAARRDAVSAAGPGLLDLFAGRACCRCCRPSSARPHPNDWMTTDAEVACPDPNCADPLPHHPARPAPLQPCRDDRGAAAGRAETTTMQRSQLAPGYAISRVIRGGWQLAGGHGAGRPRRRRSPTWSPSPTPASPPSTAPTSIPASRS